MASAPAVAYQAAGPELLRPPRGEWGWRLPKNIGPALQRDWSINLGTAGTPLNMYPAKFSFDVTVAPSCANDFVVFPIAANGSATQPNLVAFNNLYSGTAGGAGICNRTPSGTDTGVEQPYTGRITSMALAARLRLLPRCRLMGPK